jgi:Tol biopolymer transport system component
VTRTDSARAEITHRWPHFLPDGRHFIYTVVAKNGEREGVFINSLDNGQTMRIMSGRAATVYAGGSLIFVRNGMLMAQPFDIADLNTSGDVRPIRYAEQVDRFSVSANGLLVYRKRVERPPVPLAWFDREGRVIGVVDHLTEVEQFALSPDGRKIAASRLGDIWVSELERNVTSRFTFDTAEETFPIWSPDGTRILFLSHRAGQSGIFQKAINAATNEELLLTVPDLEALESSSPDGRFIAYTSRNGEGKSTIGILPLESERKPFTIPSSFNLRDPRFSPDSRWLAYVSDESGRDDIYIETFPPGGSKWKVSVDGGSKPSWRRDGRELFYVSREGMLTSVAIRAGAQSAELSVPSALFRLSWGIGPYEVSAGDRFLMSSHTEDDTSVPLDVVVNWDSEIQR